MRVALKIAYVGTGYHGSQIQPDVATIEGELFNAFRELGIFTDPKSANFQSSGRTDAGVHARGQIVAFNTDKPNLSVPRVINSLLPDSIWAWAHAEVPNRFDARKNASSRVYRYIMSGGKYDISKIRSASKILIGEHDFFNFCSKDKEKPTVREVKRIDVRVNGTITKIDVEANSFLWNMVRKMVSALTMVGSGMRDEIWLKQMLQPESYEEGLEPASSYGLTFMEVKYPIEIPWIEDAYSLRHASEKVEEYIIRHRVMAEVMQELVPKI